MHTGPAHLLQGHVLADDHLGHPRAAEVHARVALDHEDHVAERRDVGTARRRGPEEAAHLRHPAGQRDLVVEDPAGAPPPREELDLIGDPGPGGVDEPEDRQLLAQRCLRGADDLLDRPGTPGAGLDRGVVGDDDRRPPVDRAAPGHHTVRGEPGQGVRELAVLDEGALVDEQGDALTHRQLVLAGQLGGAGRRGRGGRGAGGAQRLEMRSRRRRGVRGDVGGVGRGRHGNSQASRRGGIERHATGRPRPRAMTRRWTSLVPSPISRILASR